MGGRRDVIARWRRTVVVGVLSALAVVAGGGCGGATAASASRPDASTPSSSLDASTDDAYEGESGSPCSGQGCPPTHPTPDCAPDSALYCYVDNDCPNGSQ